MRRILAVLLVLPGLVACDPLREQKFTIDAHNNSTRKAVEFRIQSTQSSGIVSTSQLFEILVLVPRRERGEITSPSDMDAKVSVVAIDPITKIAISPTEECRVRSNRVNLIIYEERSGRGSIDC